MHVMHTLQSISVWFGWVASYQFTILFTIIVVFKNKNQVVISEQLNETKPNQFSGF